MDFIQECIAVATRYAQHTLPICIYGSNTEQQKQFINHLNSVSLFPTTIVTDSEAAPQERQDEYAVQVEKAYGVTRYLFITSSSPYTLLKAQQITPLFGIVLSVLPVEL